MKHIPICFLVLWFFVFFVSMFAEESCSVIVCGKGPSYLDFPKYPERRGNPNNPNSPNYVDKSSHPGNANYVDNKAMFAANPSLNNGVVGTDGTSVLSLVYDFVASGFSLGTLKDALTGGSSSKKKSKNGKSSGGSEPVLIRHYYLAPNAFEIDYMDVPEGEEVILPGPECSFMPSHPVTPPPPPSERNELDSAIVSGAEGKKRIENYVRSMLQNVESATKQFFDGNDLPKIALEIPIESVDETLPVEQFDQVKRARAIFELQNQNPNRELVALGWLFLHQTEVDLCKNNGPVVKRKTFNRLLAVAETFIHPEDVLRTYPIHDSRLSSCFGSLVQQNIHEEMVDLVRKNEWWVRQERCMRISTVPDFFELTNITLELKDAKKYTEAYSCADFCASLLDSTLVRGLLIIPQGVAAGVEVFSSGFKAALDGALDRLLGCERFYYYDDVPCLCNHSNSCIFCNRNLNREDYLKCVDTSWQALHQKWEAFSGDVSN